MQLPGNLGDRSMAEENYTFKLIATDTHGAQDVRIVTLPVAANAPPVIFEMPSTIARVGESYSSKVSAYDPNDDALTYRIEGGQAGLAIDQEGNLSWTEPQEGNYRVTIVVTDVHGASDTRILELVVVDPNAVNQAPELTNSPPTVIPADRTFVFQLTASDKENDPLRFRLVGGPQGMTVSNTGRIEWTPSGAGDTSFTIALSDGENTVERTFDLSVVTQRGNETPTFTSEPQTSAIVGKQYVYKPTAFDPDGDAVTFELINGPGGMAMNSRGEIVWTPSTSQVGKTFEMKVRVMDSYGAGMEQSIRISVRSFIQPPTFELTPAPMGYVGKPFTHQIKATDPQGEKVTYAIHDGPDWLSINPETGVLQGTPPAEGYLEIRIIATNESGVSSAAFVLPMMVFDVTVPTYNNAPSLVFPEYEYVDAGKPWTGRIGGADPDGDPLRFSLDGYPPGMTINAETGEISWTPTSNYLYQNVKIGVTVTDDNVMTYEYDHLDRQVAVNQSNGIRSETIYNSAGQVEKTVSNIKINADGTYDYSDSITTVNTYDMYGQVVKTVTDGRIVEYEYDDLGRQTAMIDHPTDNGVRHRTESVYNELGQLVISRTNVKQLADGTIDRSAAQEQQYVYDARGNVVKTIFADGTEISAVYNEQGQKTSETNQLGQTRHFEYDIKGQLIAVVLPAVKDPESGRMVAPRYEYQYDDFGRQMLVRDPNGRETRFEYDAYGNQVARTLPLGFGKDGVQGTADDGVLPEGDFTERSIYDDNGRLFMQISFEGVITTFSYDSRGRVHQKFFWQDLTAYAEGTNPPKETWTYTYDDQGRVTCINQNGRKTETTYDSQGRTTSIKTPEGTVSYEYDKFGRQTRVSSNKGDDVRYSYDIFGRLSTVTDATSGHVTTYEYDLVGNLARTTTDTGESMSMTT